MAALPASPCRQRLSRYNSLQLRFEKRGGKYFAIQGSYTLARSTDNSSSGANGWIGWLTNGGPQVLDQPEQRIHSQRQQCHAPSGGGAYGEIPIGRGLLVGTNMNRAVDAVIGGWSASSNMTLQTGQPVHIQMSRNRISGGRQRPNVTCADSGHRRQLSRCRSGASERRVSGIAVFDTSCFADPGDQQLGNAPRYFDDVNSQGIANVDIGLRKQFRIRESSEVSGADGGFQRLQSHPF